MRQVSAYRIGAVAAAATTLLLATTTSALAQETTPQVTRAPLAEHTQLFSAPEGNLVMYNGPASILVAGVQSPALVQAALREMGARADRRLYVVAFEADSAARYGDGEWGALGAVTIAQELLRARIGRALRADSSAPARNTALGYSEVIQIYLPGVSAHVVRQKPGYTDADAIVHFHSSQLVMLGSIFTAEGYPAIDTTRGGNFMGLLESTKWFAGHFDENTVMIPARGPALRGRDLREYVAMLQSVHDRVQALVADGRTAAEIIAAQPLADLEARWGRGPVSASAFLAAVVRSLRPPPASE